MPRWPSRRWKISPKHKLGSLPRRSNGVNGLPWKIVIIIDSTLQHRASLHPENAKTFNHGKGYVIGHQWTNIVLVLGDMLMPLRPIPFYSKRYCQTHDLAYHSEHERVVAYLRTLDLEDDIGAYDRREVLVLADSGYDNKKIEKAIADKGWHFIIALSKTRSVKSEALALTTPNRSSGATSTRFSVVIAGESVRKVLGRAWHRGPFPCSRLCSRGPWTTVIPRSR